MIEKFLRRLLKAPYILSTFEENKHLPAKTVALTELQMTLVGVEPRDEVFVGNTYGFVVAGEEPTMSPDLIGYVGNGPLAIRRRILTTVKRHLFAGAWTIVGMIIVCITLTGTAQMLAVVLCFLALITDLFQLAFKRP